MQSYFGTKLNTKIGDQAKKGSVLQDQEGNWLPEIGSLLNYVWYLQQLRQLFRVRCLFLTDQVIFGLLGLNGVNSDSCSERSEFSRVGVSIGTFHPFPTLESL